MRSGKFELAWFQKFKESKADAVHARTDRGVGVLIFSVRTPKHASVYSRYD